jgi:hypothetical protein
MPRFSVKFRDMLTIRETAQVTARRGWSVMKFHFVVVTLIFVTAGKAFPDVVVDFGLSGTCCGLWLSVCGKCRVLLVRLLLHNPTFSFPSFRCCATLAMVKRFAQQLPCFSRR